MIGDVQLHKTCLHTLRFQLVYGILPARFIASSQQYFDLFGAQPARDLEADSLVRAADQRDIALKDFHVIHHSPV